MAVNRYSQRQNSQFNPFSYQELAAAPMEMRRKEDAAVEGALSIDTQNFRALDNEQIGAQEAAQGLDSQINELVSDLSTNGYSPQAFSRLNAIKRERQQLFGAQGVIGRATANYGASQAYKKQLDALVANERLGAGHADALYTNSLSAHESGTDFTGITAALGNKHKGEINRIASAIRSGQLESTGITKVFEDATGQYVYNVNGQEVKTPEGAIDLAVKEYLNRNPDANDYFNQMQELGISDKNAAEQIRDISTAAENVHKIDKKSNTTTSTEMGLTATGRSRIKDLEEGSGQKLSAIATSVAKTSQLEPDDYIDTKNALENGEIPVDDIPATREKLASYEYSKDAYHYNNDELNRENKGIALMDAKDAFVKATRYGKNDHGYKLEDVIQLLDPSLAANWGVNDTPYEIVMGDPRRPEGGYNSDENSRYIMEKGDISTARKVSNHRGLSRAFDIMDAEEAKQNEEMNTFIQSGELYQDIQHSTDEAETMSYLLGNVMNPSTMKNITDGDGEELDIEDAMERVDIAKNLGDTGKSLKIVSGYNNDGLTLEFSYKPGGATAKGSDNERKVIRFETTPQAASNLLKQKGFENLATEEMNIKNTVGHIRPGYETPKTITEGDLKALTGREHIPDDLKNISLSYDDPKDGGAGKVNINFNGRVYSNQDVIDEITAELSQLKLNDPMRLQLSDKMNAVKDEEPMLPYQFNSTAGALSFIKNVVNNNYEE